MQKTISLNNYAYRQKSTKITLSYEKQIIDDTSDNQISKYQSPTNQTIFNQLELIRKMRENVIAPVDTMGCDQQICQKSDLNNQAFQVLISLILSVQTKDEITNKCMQRLFKEYEYNLKIKDIYDIEQEKLQELIKEVNFKGQKGKYIKEAAKKIIEQNGGEMYKCLGEIEKLKGVGKKIGILLMQTVYKENVGIAVDTHVHKVANRLNWVHTKNPDQTMNHLQAIIPSHSWPTINHLLVGFGQTICKTKPLCSQCTLSSSCPFYQSRINKIL